MRGDKGRAAIAETHVSVLLFVGDRVYKLKKAVAIGFLDFSMREAPWRREVGLNRTLARTYISGWPLPADGPLRRLGAGQGDDDHCRASGPTMTPGVPAARQAPVSALGAGRPGVAGQVGRGLGSAGHLQLREDGRDVVLHGLLSQLQLGADLAIGITLGNQGQNALLLR